MREMRLSYTSQTYSCVDEMHQSNPHTSQPTNRPGWLGLLLTIVAAAVVGWRSSPLGRRSSDWPIGDLDAICILDAGNNGVISKASHVLAKKATASTPT